MKPISRDEYGKKTNKLEDCVYGFCQRCNARTAFPPRAFYRRTRPTCKQCGYPVLPSESAQKEFKHLNIYSPPPPKKDTARRCPVCKRKINEIKGYSALNIHARLMARKLTVLCEPCEREAHERTEQNQKILARELAREIKRSVELAEKNKKAAEEAERKRKAATPKTTKEMLAIWRAQQSRIREGKRSG